MEALTDHDCHPISNRTKSTRFNIILSFHIQYFNLSSASNSYSAGHDIFLIRKTSTLKELFSLLPLPWQPTTAQLNTAHIFPFSYIEKVKK